MPEEQAARVETPKTLYKYMTVEAAKQVLSSRRVRFSSPLTFNDPYDCQWNPLWWMQTDELHDGRLALLRTAIHDPATLPADAGLDVRSALLRCARRRLVDDSGTPTDSSDKLARSLCRSLAPGTRVTLPYWNHVIGRFRVFCLAAECDSILMWSHYAKQHSGVVLGFATDVLQQAWDLRAMPVQYHDRWPDTEGKDTFNEIVSFDRAVDLPYSQAAASLMTIKATSWRYEREWRYFFLDDTEDDKHTLIDFPGSSLETVVVGARCANSDAANITESARQANKSVSIRGAKIKSGEFRISIL